MKSFASGLLALAVLTCSLFAQTTPADSSKPVPPAGRDNAVSGMDDRGAAQPAARPVAPPKTNAAYIPKEAAPNDLLTLIKSGGWTMVPLGVMSVLTVMLTLIFLATLRRS